jgi:hypothetical protein
LRLVSARGDVRLDLKDQSAPVTTEYAQTEQPGTAATTSSRDPIPASEMRTEVTDVFVKLERLADLNKKGIISDGEFAARKRELLDRI